MIWFEKGLSFWRTTPRSSAGRLYRSLTPLQSPNRLDVLDQDSWHRHTVGTRRYARCWIWSADWNRLSDDGRTRALTCVLDGAVTTARTRATNYE